MTDTPSVFCALGLMSGTSMDGIDGALLRTDGVGILEEGLHGSLVYEKPFHHALKMAEYGVRCHGGDLGQSEGAYAADALAYGRESLGLSASQAQALKEKVATYFGGTFPSLSQVLDHSTDLHGALIQDLLRKANFTPSQVDIIGYHGQTLYHKPDAGITLQCGHGGRLADLTGIPVIHQFRLNDVAHGGQGAPFAPLYHQALALRDGLIPAALVNCGGISNVTFIFDSSEEGIMGFDTGPGNGLIDGYIKHKTQGKETYDRDGHYGLRGRRHEGLMAELYESLNDFFKRPPPKSLDIADFSLPARAAALPLEDVARTLEEFTAETILRGLDFIPRPKAIPLHWIVAGGGWKNPVIFKTFEERLKEKIPNATLSQAQDKGWNGDALEAQIFAYLAVRSLRGLPLSLPLTTGVPSPLGGGILVNPFQKDKIYL